MSCAVESSTDGMDVVPTGFYSCKRCCARLFDDSHVMHDSQPGSQLGVEPSAAVPRNELANDNASQRDSTEDGMKAPLGRKEWLRENWVKASAVAGTGCTSVFTHSVPDWAASTQGNSGRFTCPKCKAKIGNFVWSGASCSCGEWITPSFQFQLARVDRKGTVEVPIVQPGGRVEPTDASCLPTQTGQ